MQSSEFVSLLKANDITCYTGVPDSLLKHFLSYITEQSDARHHLINANEGSAIAWATGYHLATGNIALVYMQNSGLGNAVNPLVSLADEAVYSIPMLLLVGWRGEPGVKDEPQHIKQGIITEDLLNTLRIPHAILPDSAEASKDVVDSACAFMRREKRPYALLARKGTFDKSESVTGSPEDYELRREDALKLIVEQLDARDVVVSTTGKTSRELFEYREALGHGHHQDFLTVGSMGHASQIALGAACAIQDRNVFCIDGDGAFIMHMGSPAIIGSKGPSNFKHILINNGVHDSVGGQPTVGFKIDMAGIAKACGYRQVFTADRKESVTQAVREIIRTEGPALLEVRVRRGARDDLGRPTTTPTENKDAFMSFLTD
jgi:phosphonopyruvate decarboxylase